MPTKKKTTAKTKAPKWETASYAIVQNLQALVEEDARWTHIETDKSLQTLETSLTKLVAAQRPAPDADAVLPNRDENDFIKFEDWLREQHDIDLKKLGLKLSTVEGEVDNVTLVATESHEADKPLVSVPHAAMMSTAHLAALGISPVLRLAPELARDPSVLLSLVLLKHALDNPSPLQPYVRVLPRNFTTPFWSYRAATLDALRPSPAYSRAVNTMRALVRRYARVYSALRTLNLPSLPVAEFSWARYVWAVSVVMTRQNELPTNPRALALVPVWDLCNHSPGKHTTSVAVNPETGGVSVECIAMKKFESGDDVTIFYGMRPNSELLLFSGFVQPNNEYDTYAIPLPLRRSDPLHPLKKRVLEKAKVAIYPKLRNDADPLAPNDSDVEEWIARVHANSDGSMSEDGRAVARIISMDKAALATFLRSGDILPPRGSTEEALALSVIVEAANGVLERYLKPTSDTLAVDAIQETQLRLINQLLTEERNLLQRVILRHSGPDPGPGFVPAVAPAPAPRKTSCCSGCR